MCIYMYTHMNFPDIFDGKSPPGLDIVGDGRFSTNKFLYYGNIQNRPMDQ